ncbi:YlxR family protein [Nakamurella endophytica]|uniref:YlxR domain-containing protein n=1 Tax=Nakamurella endophytica TaxID=1748367 RepID=A0A917WEH9_9ACTN|nr:YlxR family protein [Nakamurella endophytica]GGL95495.1 hypothetical protein GCM10011594_13920 [Nakamurella endophytica]
MPDPGSPPGSDPGAGGPVRTCVGCRRRAAVSELLRVVGVAGELVPDHRRRLPGRGAWLHPDRRCLDEAERRRAFGRALRQPGLLDTSRVRALVDPVPGPGAGDAGRGPSRSTAAEPRTTESRSTSREHPVNQP